MPATPTYKVLNPEGVYVIDAWYAEDAALCAGMYGPGSKIKKNGRIVWREGFEEVSGADSADRACSIIRRRERYAADERRLRYEDGLAVRAMASAARRERAGEGSAL